jgi:hypothetical protein
LRIEFARALHADARLDATGRGRGLAEGDEDEDVLVARFVVIVVGECCLGSDEAGGDRARPGTYEEVPPLDGHGGHHLVVVCGTTHLGRLIRAGSPPFAATPWLGRNALTRETPLRSRRLCDMDDRR